MAEVVGISRVVVGSSPHTVIRRFLAVPTCVNSATVRTIVMRLMGTWGTESNVTILCTVVSSTSF